MKKILLLAFILLNLTNVIWTKNHFFNDQDCHGINMEQIITNLDLILTKNNLNKKDVLYFMKNFGLNLTVMGILGFLAFFFIWITSVLILIIIIIVLFLGENNIFENEINRKLERGEIDKKVAKILLRKDKEIEYKTSTDEKNVKIIYYLYLATLVFQVSIIIGVIIAFFHKKDTPEWLKTHYIYQIRTFWIGLIYLIIASITVLFLIGFIFYFLIFLWYIIRCIQGLKLINQRKEVQQPKTWLFT